MADARHARRRRKKNPHAVALGRLGGRVGGKARVPKGIAMLTKEERHALAKKAAAARWGKKTKRTG
jgi:hypothetical protein